MPKYLITITVSVATFFLISLPQINAGSKPSRIVPSSLVIMDSLSKTDNALVMVAIYDSLRLKKFGLGKQAFFYAYSGYQKLLEEGKITKQGIITICDFSQSSRRKRLYVLDIDNFAILLNTYVAHGKRSGGEYATKFSNRHESHQSSLGFYMTKNTYYGEHGLSLVIDGLERGINCNAEGRRIVVHGSRYVGDARARSSMGRSFGCPAVPKKYSNTLINTIKNGSVLFIYHPSQDYRNESTMLN